MHFSSPSRCSRSTRARSWRNDFWRETRPTARTGTALPGGSSRTSISKRRVRVSACTVTRSTLPTVALVVLLLAGMAPFVDIDVWHQMALFRDGLRHGWIPYQDRFAYTPTINP